MPLQLFEYLKVINLLKIWVRIHNLGALRWVLDAKNTLTNLMINIQCEHVKLTTQELKQPQSMCKVSFRLWLVVQDRKVYWFSHIADIGLATLHVCGENRILTSHVVKGCVPMVVLTNYMVDLSIPCFYSLLDRRERINRVKMPKHKINIRRRGEGL